MKLDVDQILSGLQDLDQRVGTQAFSAPKLDLSDPGRQLSIFDQAFSLDSDLRASATIHAAKEALDDPFGVAPAAPASSGDSFATVDISGDLNLSGSGSGSTEGASFSAHATAGAGFSYQHRLSVSQSRKRSTVLTDALGGVRLPQRVDLATLEPGESHRMTAKINLDLGLDASVGASTQNALTVALFDGLSTQVTAQGSATVQAALGLSLFDQMALTVGRGPAADSWPRIRIQRRHQRKLSLGATLSLVLQYDLGSGLIEILDNALDQVPTPRLLTTFREIDGLLASGDWSAVTAQLTDRGAAVLDDYLGQTGWRKWLANSDEVKDFVTASNRIVAAFDGVDERVEGLWEQLLGKVDLGEGSEIRKVLGQVADIDPSNPDVLRKLIKGQTLNEALELIQKLSGHTLDELIVESVPEAQKILKRAVDLAQQALAFLTGTPQQVIDAINDFADKTGIRKTLDFLAANASSPQAIEGLVSDRIRQLVETLVGKAWKEIDADDLAKVQTWAEKVQRILDAPDELAERLRTTLRKLQGQASFTASVAIDNEASRSALIDLELDVARAPQLAAKIQTALGSGKAADIAKTLEALDNELATQDDAKTNDDGAPKTPPFRLRESVFASRRVRTRSFSLAFLGFGASFSRKGMVRRIEESRLRIRPVAGQNDTYERLGHYSAGFVRREENDSGSNETAIWLENTPHGPGLDPAAPFDGAPDSTLRLVYNRQDTKATAKELADMAKLLARLGFEEHGSVRQQVRDGWTTQLTVELRFIDPEGQGGAAFRALVGDGGEEAWNTSFLAAAKAWFDNRLDDKGTRSGLSYGDIFGQLIRTPVFRDNWTGGAFSLAQAAARQSVFVEVGNDSEPISWTDFGGDPNMQLGVLYGSLLPKRRRGLAAMGRLSTTLGNLETHHDPAHYRQLNRDFVDAGLRSAVYGANWPSSLFVLWLALARLGRKRPDLLATAHGLALLRTRVDNEDDWHDPLRLTLENGIPNLV